VAEQVMRMPDPVVQRQCQSCSDSSASSLREEEPRIQRQTNGDGGARELTSDLTSHLGAGAPLDTASRRYFEPRFGHDFGNVRIHDGPRPPRRRPAFRPAPSRSDMTWCLRRESMSRVRIEESDCWPMN
jgi:hypothetical protein